jgi:hypothetical protein
MNRLQSTLDGSVPARYAFAALAVGVMVLVRLACDPLIGPTAYPLTMMFPAILVATWAGGRGAGLFALAIAVVAVQWGITEPRGEFKPMNGERAIGLVIFILAAGACVLLATAQRQARATIRDIGRARLRSERQTRALLASLPNGAGFVIDDALVVRIAEGELADVFGNAPPDLVGRPVGDVLTSVGPDEAWFRGLSPASASSARWPSATASSPGAACRCRTTTIASARSSSPQQTSPTGAAPARSSAPASGSSVRSPTPCRSWCGWPMPTAR